MISFIYPLLSVSKFEFQKKQQRALVKYAHSSLSHRSGSPVTIHKAAAFRVHKEGPPARWRRKTAAAFRGPLPSLTAMCM